MTRRQRRLLVAVGGTAILAVAVLLVLNAMRDNLVFFYGPTELAEKHVEPGRTVRIGGLVQPGSVQRDPHDASVRFRVSDQHSVLTVRYSGALPDLFREGQGVVAEGALAPDGTFTAQQVLAKHDERYMPREVAEALKKSGRWQEGGVPSGPAPSRAEAGR